MRFHERFLLGPSNLRSPSNHSPSSLSLEPCLMPRKNNNPRIFTGARFLFRLGPFPIVLHLPHHHHTFASPPIHLALGSLPSGCYPSPSSPDLPPHPGSYHHTRAPLEATSYWCLLPPGNPCLPSELALGGPPATFSQCK